MTAPVVAAIEPCPLAPTDAWDRVRLLERAYRRLCRDELDAMYAGRIAEADALKPQRIAALEAWREAQRAAPPRHRVTRPDCALGHRVDSDVECGAMCVRGTRQGEGFR